MYSFLITCTMALWPLFTYIVFFDIYIYMRWCMFFFTFVSHVLFLSFFIHMFLLVYILSMFYTWCLDESCLSVSVKIGCKSTMPWSLFLQSFQEFVLGLDLYTFVYYGIVVLALSHNCFLWFCHELPKREIVRVIFCVIS